jgi:hypothetical protein
VAQPYVTGPCLIWIGVPNQVAAQLVISQPPPYTTPTGSGSVFTAGPYYPGSIDVYNLSAAITPAQSPSQAQSIISFFFRDFTPVFLGTGEGKPAGAEIEIERAESPVMNDAAGNILPADLMHEGEQGWISTVLTRYNESVYAWIANRTAGAVYNTPPFGTPSPRGIDPDGSIGTLLVQEGAAYPVWLAFPYAGKPAYSTMPYGYRFFACTLVDADKLPVNPGGRKVGLTWRALRLDGFGAWALYDHDLTGLTAPN